MELMSSEIEILIIEDEHIIALGLRKLLLDLSFKNITIINTAKEGIEYIRKSLPEIVFLDMNLHGELQGIDVLKFIEFHKLHTHIIITTGDRKYALEAIHYTPMEYLLKPIDLDELMGALKKITNHFELHNNDILYLKGA